MIGAVPLRPRTAGGQRLLVGACVCALLCVLAATADAATAYAPPAGWPDLGAMAFAPTDFGAGAAVKRQGYVRPDSDTLAEYDREFRELSVRLGAKRLSGIEDDVMLTRTPADADVFIQSIRLGILLVSNDLGKEFARSSHLKVTYTKVGKPEKLGIGDNSVGVAIRIGTRIGEVRVVLAAVRVGQIVSAFYLAGLPRGKIGIPEAKRLARLAVAHTRATLVPSSSSPPTISGTAQAGQTLTALPGTWLSFPTSYTYQWQRCDVSGAGCAAIAGATSTTYVVAPEDVGATLTVAVAAVNPYGTGTRSSTPTGAVVAAAPAPGG